jgi:predicted nucleic acid-binding protein
MIIVSNAGPLIALAKIERFGLLRALFNKIAIPQAVYDEVVVRGKGRAGADETRKAVGDWIEVQDVQNEAMVKGFLTKLGRGESETIALALELEADLVLLDDYKARTTAEFMGLNITGTVGVLKRILDELRVKGVRLSDKVYSEVLKIGKGHGR